MMPSSQSVVAQGQGQWGCSRDSAIRCLRDWARTQPNIKPADETHILAYCMLRQTTSRPRVEQLFAAINSQTRSFEHGIKRTTSFNLVPVQNFTKRVPAWLAPFVHSEETMRSRYVVPDDLDFNAYYVVDLSANRGRLGNFVEQVSFYNLSSGNMRVQLGDVRSRARAGPAAPLALENGDPPPPQWWVGKIIPG